MFFKNKFLKIVLFSAILGSLLVFSGCGGGGSSSGGDDDSSSNNSSSSNSETQNNYPNVAGKYSFNTDKIKFQCTDGETGSIAPIASQVIVHETNGTLIIENTLRTQDTPGITFIDETQMTGNVRKDGTFITNRQATLQMDGISGEITATYTLSGKFFQSGWTGKYEYVAFIQDAKVTCIYTTSFDGDLISSRSITIDNSILNNNTGVIIKDINKKILDSIKKF